MKENTKLNMRGLRERQGLEKVSRWNLREQVFERIIQTVLYSIDTSQEKTQTGYLAPEQESHVLQDNKTKCLPPLPWFRPNKD